MQGIPCSIDVLTDRNETCWLVTIANSSTSTTALQLSALQNDLLSKVSLYDSRNNINLTIDTHFAACEKETVAVGPVIGSHAGPGVYGFIVIFD